MHASEARTEREGRWRELMRQRSESGQSRVDFCRERGIKTCSMRYWERKMRRADGGLGRSVPRVLGGGFVGVQLAPGREWEERERSGGDGVLTAWVGGVRLEIGRGFDAEVLRGVVDVLRGR